MLRFRGDLETWTFIRFSDFGGFIRRARLKTARGFDNMGMQISCSPHTHLHTHSLHTHSEERDRRRRIVRKSNIMRESVREWLGERESERERERERESEWESERGRVRRGIWEICQLPILYTKVLCPKLSFRSKKKRERKSLASVW